MAEQTKKPGGARTMREAAQRVGVPAPSPEELAALEGEADYVEEGPATTAEDPEAEADAREVPHVKEADFETQRNPSGVPAWVRIPADLAFPPHGVTWAAMKFEPEWTDRPSLGERQCILWNLSVGDEKFARKRARGDAESMLDEQAKTMIRAIDGRRIDWSSPTNPASPDRFWDEIGKKCRMMVLNYFMKVHTLEPAEKLHFFANCPRREDGRAFLDGAYGGEGAWPVDPDWLIDTLDELCLLGGYDPANQKQRPSPRMRRHLDATWPLMVEVDPDEQERGRRYQRVYMARYGRGSLLESDWYDVDLEEFNETFRELSELISRENAVTNEAEDR